MTLQKLRSVRGFTLLELIVVIVIVGVLISVALDRLLYYQERAEQAMMVANIEAFKMGLRIRLAQLIATGHGEQLPQLETENPVRWLESPPTGYAGEYHVPTTPQSWYFVSKTHELVYVPNSKRNLVGGEGRDQEVRFRAKLVYEPNGRQISSVTLLPVTKYQWF